MAPPALALIVASPGTLREGLHAVLTTLSRLDEVIEVDNTTAALTLFPGRTPALVLVSTDPDGSNPLENCRQIKSCWPDSPCLALVDTVGLEPAALAAGADYVLVKGARPDKLLGRIDRLLAERSLDKS